MDTSSGQANIFFYDSISGDYNFLETNAASNKVVRKKIEEKFLQKAKGKVMMDFGGGTGLDLEWIAAAGFRIYFCEPSEKMRAQAIQLNRELIRHDEIIFLDNDQSDFRTWQNKNPIPEKTDAILANFAVLNNIADLKLLFEVLAEIIKPGGIMVANTLNPRPFKLYKSRFLKMIFSLITNKTFTVKIKQKGVTQIIFLHSVPKIKRSAAPFFEITSIDNLGGFGFLCIELTRTNVHSKD